MKNILCIAGDGIGPEIMKSALEILEVVSKKYDFQYKIEEEFFGGASIDAYGEPFSDKLKEKIENCDAILMGSVGGPKWDNAKIRPEAGLLALRKYLKVYANVRPLKVEDSLCYLSPLKEEIVKGTDLMILRELTGGAYFGEPRRLEEKSALDSITYSYEEIEHIVRYAFETARKRRKKLTSVDKANVLATSKLWRKVVEDVAKDYEDVELEHMYVDAMAMALITNPTKYDVIVTENLFGDILSDEVSVLGGSLGLLSSASYSKDKIALYEPAHGSAPDIAGMDIANPIAMIYSLAMMLRYSFAQDKMADDIEIAVKSVLDEGCMTKDLNSQNYVSTSEFTKKLIQKLG
jgi:3-isopropylmalate dehydrogenase